MTEQEKEIETMKERCIYLKLSDADVDRISKKAGEVGMSVSCLLENFVGDLVCGTYSNGSDERLYANEWFDRCCFEFRTERTFLSYLISTCQLEDLLECLEDIAVTEVDLEFYDSSQESDREEIEFLQQSIEGWKLEVEDYFAGYKEWAREEALTDLKGELDKILAWKQEKEQLLNANVSKKDNMRDS